MGTFNVSLKTLTDRVSMEVVYTPRELDEISVEIAEVNRPGLFLAGYYDYFDKLRLQIMGLAEMNFLSGLTAEKRYEALEQLFRQQPPAVIVCRSEELAPFPEMQELAQKHGDVDIRYDVVRDEGPDHDKTIWMKIMINGKDFGTGVGKNKKEAAQQAAKEAIERIHKGERF